MTSGDVKRVIALMERHGIAAFDYEQGDVQIHLTLAGNETAVLAEIQQPAPEPDVLRSSGVGRVLFSHPTSAEPSPALPRRAASGETVAFIRTGMTLRAVVAKRDCLLVRALVGEGKGVGYDDALFEIAP